MPRPEDEDGAPGFEAGEGETSVEQVTGVGVEARVTAQFPCGRHGDVAELTEGGRSRGEGSSHLSKHLLLAQDHGLQAGSDRSQVRKGVDASEAYWSGTGAVAEPVSLDPLAALDNGCRAAVHGCLTLNWGEVLAR